MKQLLMIACVLAVVGCGGDKLPANESAEQAQELPEGHPPLTGGEGSPAGMAAGMGGSSDGAPVATDDNPLPLKLSGLNGVPDLEAGKARASSPEAAAAFEQGFRLTFTEDRAKRDYPQSAQILEGVVATDPELPHAYRALGYAKFNIGFDVPSAMENYQKAVALDPQYGEAHYALAFLYVTQDVQTGAGHFKIAMDLGVPDERDLGARFYSQSPQ